jgi:CheY-like chemotaxis protein
MNSNILLVEDNPDDQFLIQRALNKRLLNKVNLFAAWSKPMEKTANYNSSSLNKIDLSYPPISSVGEGTELGISVKLVEDKEEAINYLTGKKTDANRQCYPLPDLILISVKMPHLSGLCLLSWIKRQPELIHIPVVIISDVDKKDQAMNLGAIAYIFKTLCFTDLTEVVRAFLLSGNHRCKEQCQSNKRRSQPLQGLANPSTISKEMSNRGVMKAASWRKRGQKIGHSSLQVPL